MFEPPMRRVVASRLVGLRHELTMSCGHTADAVHVDDYVACLSCRSVEKLPRLWQNAVDNVIEKLQNV